MNVTKQAQLPEFALQALRDGIGRNSGEASVRLDDGRFLYRPPRPKPPSDDDGQGLLFPPTEGGQDGSGGNPMGSVEQPETETERVVDGQVTGLQGQAMRLNVGTGRPAKLLYPQECESDLMCALCHGYRVSVHLVMPEGRVIRVAPRVTSDRGRPCWRRHSDS